ncbi:MAG: radical SAM protein [Deltaproteobacteria bacterium]|nr:radical SAM protein [Deltaproteobacteria bacterium]
MSRLRRVLHPLYRKLECAVHPLRYLFLEITQRCNLRCRHCGSDCGRDTRLDELSTDEWLAFFGYLAVRCDRRKLALVLTGGEPLCHPEWDRILRGLREHGLAWGMVSNGFGLDRENMARAVEAGLISLTVSLDGMRKSHDQLRGRKGSFERAVKALELAVAARVRFLDVVTCVHPGNLDELDSVMGLLERIGLSRWRLFSIFPKGRARENEDLLMGAEGFKRMLGFIEEAREQKAARGFHVDFSCEGYLPDRWERAVRDEPYFCRAGISIGSVLCDGAISACPNISRSLVQGNIRTDDFLTVWEERFQPFRDRSWLRKGPCADCAHFAACQGNSLHLYDEQLGHTVLCTYKLLCD